MNLDKLLADNLVSNSSISMRSVKQMSARDALSSNSCFQSLQLIAQLSVYGDRMRQALVQRAVFISAAVKIELHLFKLELSYG